MPDSIKYKYNMLFDEQFTFWCSFQPTKGATVYTCYSCRDMFRLKSSFLDHVNRRVAVIYFTCQHCQGRILTFYNPCSFHLHARSHFSNSSGEINLSDVRILILPPHLAGYNPHPDVPLRYNTPEDTLGETIEQNNRFYLPTVDSIGQEIVKMTPLILMFEDCNSSERLVLKQMSSNVPFCKFLAIQDLTQSDVEVKTEPVDEDAVECESEDDSNKCPECNEVPEDEDMPAHFLQANKPFEKSLSCAKCTFIAPSICGLLAHTRLHNFQAPYVCPECGKVFKDKDELIEHIDKTCFHFCKLVKYRCPAKNCGKIFAHLQTYSTHFATHVSTTYKCTECNFAVSNNYQIILKHSAEEHKDIALTQKMIICSVCKETNKDKIIKNSKDHIEAHCMNRSNLVYVFICKYCRSYFRSNTTFVTHLERCPKRLNAEKGVENKKLNISFCLKCMNRIRYPSNFSITSCNKCGTLLTDIVKNVTLKTCYLCKSTEHDLSKCPYSNPQVVLNKLDIEYYNKTLEDETDNVSNEKRRKLSEPQIKEEFLEVILTEFEGNRSYKCKICGYKGAGKDEFHDHVLIHREPSSLYQCMNCGDCFLVKPTFEKHLVYAHNISDVDAYIAENDCYFPKENGKAKENQCEICLAEFDSSLEMNKHLRTHGMAFLLNNNK